MQHAPARLCGGTCTERKEQAATRNVCGKQTLELSQHRCHTVALGTRSLASSTRTPRARIHATIGARRSMTPPGRRPLNDCLRTARHDPLQHGTHIVQTFSDGNGKEFSGGVRC